MNEIKLKPCPFCGGTAIERFADDMYFLNATSADQEGKKPERWMMRRYCGMVVLLRQTTTKTASGTSMAHIFIVRNAVVGRKIRPNSAHTAVQK